MPHWQPRLTVSPHGRRFSVDNPAVIFSYTDADGRSARCRSCRRSSWIAWPATLLVPVTLPLFYVLALAHAP